MNGLRDNYVDKHRDCQIKGTYKAAGRSVQRRVELYQISALASALELLCQIEFRRWDCQSSCRCFMSHNCSIYVIDTHRSSSVADHALQVFDRMGRSQGAPWKDFVLVREARGSDIVFNYCDIRWPDRRRPGSSGFCNRQRNRPCRLVPGWKDRSRRRAGQPLLAD